MIAGMVCFAEIMATKFILILMIGQKYTWVKLFWILYISTLRSFLFFKLLNLSFVITLRPVFDSICLRAFPAILPPSLATLLLSSNPFGSRSWDISVVAVSASIFKTSSRFVILSRRFSFLRPFNFLYSFVLMPVHALVISFVRMANSIPSCTPLFSHSSVSVLRTSILLRRWLTQFLLYPFFRYVLRARLIASSGSAVSSSRSYPTRASHSLNGSALGEGIDWMIRSMVSVSAISVRRILPSAATIFKT